MQHSDATEEFLQMLQRFSGGKLTRAEDLGTLIELGRTEGMDDVLSDLSFLAKFLSRTHGIMARIGKEGEGYDKLAQEFGSGMERGRALLQILLEAAPDVLRQRFQATYLSMTQPGIQNLMALYYDLSWYKNWLIDTGRTPPGVS